MSEPTEYEIFTKDQNADILKTLKDKKGQFSRAIWCREVKVKKGMPEFKKCTVMNVRTGIDYDNLKSVKDKRESGELPEENQGLPWGEWEEFPILIKHKEVLYARLYPAPDCTMEVEYFDSTGHSVTYEEVEPYMLASEKRKEDDKKPDCICVKLNDLVELY